MDESRNALTEPPKSNDRAGVSLVYIFDGKGGVSRCDNGIEIVVPQRGFVLYSGNMRAPEYKMWLRNELGNFNADVLTVPSSRSRCTVNDDKALLVLRVARPSAEPDDMGRQLLSLWIERGKVIVASELNIPEFLSIAQWQQSHHAPVSPADLVARLALRAADRLEPLVERLGDSLDGIEEALLLDAGTNVSAKLGQLRRTLINFRRLVAPQRDVLNTLEIEDLSFLSSRDRVRLREASARSVRIGDELQVLSERAGLVHEQILDGRAEQMNRTILVLTAATVVFMPLTVVSGVLGMNVSGIPFSDNPYAFTGVCVALLTLAVATVWWMRSRSWL